MGMGKYGKGIMGYLTTNLPTYASTYTPTYTCTPLPTHLHIHLPIPPIRSLQQTEKDPTNIAYVHIYLPIYPESI